MFPYQVSKRRTWSPKEKNKVNAKLDQEDTPPKKEKKRHVNDIPKAKKSHIPLPADLAAKKGVVNPQNMDNEYFRWAILSALYPVGQKAEHIAQYRQYVNELNFEGIKFPVQADEIILQRFE
ncbi:hypothetical protein RhiirA5_417435 [Rhizophagus irregularis]|uniref:Uncharacterized protein n=1 Tax=Rhizophagus irregularis TaxID=588596 RepID=A0A2N0PMF4_9GLOM|nr:hypothetical protein RhiirA5_417435 [Rhizophagus irregularis]